MDFENELHAALANNERFITADGRLDAAHVMEAAHAQDTELMAEILESPVLSDVLTRQFGNVVYIDCSRLAREISVDTAVKMMEAVE